MAKATNKAEATPGERLDRAIQGTREKIGKTVDSARDHVGSIMEEARHGIGSVRDGLGTLKEKSPDDLVEDTRQLVRENPGTSVLVCLGAGILLGWMLRGKD